MSHTLLCGAGREKITPPVEWITKLPALMGLHFSGVIFDELYVRAIAIRNEKTTILIISYDLDKGPNPAENLELLSEEFGIPVENILYFGVHTHTAPITGVRPHEKMNNKATQPADVRATMDEYEAFVQNQMRAAVSEAIQTLRPARIGWSTGESWINTNRCQNFDVRMEDGTVQRGVSLGVDPTGVVDRTVFVWKAEDLSGTPIAYFVNYAVHCCAMIGNDSDGKGGVGISGDIAGVVSQMMEAQLGGVAVWSSGAAGDINPVMMNQYYYPDPATGATATLEAEGCFAACAALKVLSARHFADICRIVPKLYCDTESAELYGAVDLVHTPGRKWDDGKYKVEKDAYEVRVHPVLIGDVLLCGVGGELYTTLGWEIQKASPLAYTCIINHDACLMGSVSYICDDETIARFEKNLPGHFLPGLRDCPIEPGYLATALPEAVRRILRGLGVQ